MENEPRLYIVMFKDTPDMNPGKAIAQGSHATSLFETIFMKGETFLESDIDPYNEWKSDLKFGTTIVLEGNRNDFYEVNRYFNYCGVVFDPTYPIKNWWGDIYTTGMETCAWIFPTTDEEVEVIKQAFKLHR